MEASPCAGLYAITADMDFELHYGKRANKRRKMYNGMIPCQLYMYYNAPKTEKVAKPMPKSGFDGKRTHFEKEVRAFKPRSRQTLHGKVCLLPGKSSTNTRSLSFTQKRRTAGVFL